MNDFVDKEPSKGILCSEDKTFSSPLSQTLFIWNWRLPVSTTAMKLSNVNKRVLWRTLTFFETQWKRRGLKYYTIQKYIEVT